MHRRRRRFARQSFAFGARRAEVARQSDFSTMFPASSRCLPALRSGTLLNYAVASDTSGLSERRAQ
jgi:hypothetical protein